MALTSYLETHHKERVTLCYCLFCQHMSNFQAMRRNRLRQVLGSTKKNTKVERLLHQKNYKLHNMVILDNFAMQFLITETLTKNKHFIETQF